MEERIKREEVEYLSKLARIELTEEEKKKFEKELEKILDYIGKLNEIPTEGIEPTYHVLPITNIFREDIPSKSTPKEEMLANAPDQDGNFFKVPRII
ncbi:MAG: Asp-tRNA(Asn)/Glu-tRNA(Gln) amidotransferase subunit GatC [bacterium]|nr:Asp-tRNA(Asn)/Glu-tRNA(Gln) amidotransferase subunit GatC [bacterium]MCX7917112.1 Asp-tRNA(Asn)/Glu-tRNA(Gln) amidotransferase subunit GatC [bacterium]MDW8163654.1 Asp-tRNA(Asn)/Glu-tRNA(Gln) amidotransferase subunit GatC [Candidatus Omnitrophota bacterium]